MDFEGDAFISYAHLDNKGLSEGQKGWVANFQHALETRVAQLVGREAQVWGDPELRGNEVFSDILIERLRSVASLISILSPAYVNSKWGQRELTEFCKAAEQGGKLQISDKARVFKVLKTPVPLEQQPAELLPFLGYEFFKVDQETGRVRELSEMFGDDAQRDFWMKLNELAAERAAAGAFSRLLWIPPGLSVADERQRKVLQDVRMDQPSHEGTDLLENTLEDLQTAITARLAAPAKAPRASATPTMTGAALLYLIYDQRDAQAATAWADLLFKDFEIVLPIFDGDEKDIREFHEDSLRTCDGVLILFGAANEAWLRRKLTDIQKSPGYGRSKASPDVAICFIPPNTPTKASFKTHYATVIPQFDGCTPEPLAPFVATVKARVAGSPG